MTKPTATTATATGTHLEVTLTGARGAYHLTALQAPPAEFTEAQTLCGKGTFVAAGLRTAHPATCTACLAAATAVTR